MTKMFREYFWKGGIPYGRGSLENGSERGFKIVMDPYRKRISVEKYAEGKFSSVIYDSALFDFRLLKPEDQLAWHKEMLAESENEGSALIRNQDDRVIVVETYTFEKGLCRECLVKTPQGVHVSTQRMYYASLGDAFNGVVLFDINSNPVMYKRYEVDAAGEFSTLIEEHWNLESATLKI